MDIPQHIHSVLADIDSPESERRWEARRTIELHRDEWVSTFVEALNSPDTDVRRSATAALEACGRYAGLAEDRLISALSDDDTWVRYGACHALSQSHRNPAKVAKAAMSLLDHDVWNLRQSALVLLSVVAHSEGAIADRVITCVTDHVPNVRSTAIEALGRIGVWKDSFRTDLERVLRDDSWEVRQELSRAVGSLPIPEVIANAWLLTLLTDPVSDVRAEAAKTIRRRGNIPMHAVAPLIGVLADPLEDVRSHARYALVSLGSIAIPELLKAVSSQDMSTRGEAARALGEIRIRDDAITAAVRRAMDDWSAFVRLNAAFAYWKLTDDAQTSVMCISAILDPNESLVPDAATALARIGGLAMGAVGRLEMLAGLGRPPAQFAALVAIARIGPRDRTCLDVFTRLARSPDAHTRRVAIKGSATLWPRDPTVVERLREALADNDLRVRLAALLACLRNRMEEEVGVGIVRAAAADLAVLEFARLEAWAGRIAALQDTVGGKRQKRQ